MKHINQTTQSATSKRADALIPDAGMNGNPLPSKNPADSQITHTVDPRLKRRIDAKLENLKPARFINGKPEFVVPTTTVLNTNSGFGHKKLCDFLTFTSGSACVFSCSFCYVVSLLHKNKFIRDILDGTGLKFSDIVVRRENPVQRLREQLTSRGRPKFKDPADNRVIYASPLVDIAATMELINETVEMCLVILELTNWQIRLLSKSPLLLKVAERIPDKFRSRLIFGFSTGNLDVGIARAIEKGTGLVSKRIEALHTLQDKGYRTYGMVCPILPQADIKAYATQVAEAIRVGRCEEVWAEILNSRDASMMATQEALRQRGYTQEADLFAQVTRTAESREDYARQTFLALADVIPANKFRFLQYVSKATLPWWSAHKSRGAVLLGRAAQNSDLAGSTTGVAA